ncbi:hypothetical protein E2C01_011312 [Portunus trituberculatus]|uniref:Uncharacterized protein n=1 Tax=Portunus trituberculatus TaxID=210409 RepID=A0A5B7DAQ2_PORTR|nr:hypothetical protein [Portunus trituberculatus]
MLYSSYDTPEFHDAKASFAKDTAGTRGVMEQGREGAARTEMERWLVTPVEIHLSLNIFQYWEYKSCWWYARRRGGSGQQQAGRTKSRHTLKETHWSADEVPHCGL